jgi:hypothetical protein
MQNDAKRARADKKSAEEAATRLRIEGDLAFLTRELELLRAENEAIERDIARLRRYARYLEEVVSNSSSGFLFDSASDVLARCVGSRVKQPMGLRFRQAGAGTVCLWRCNGEACAVCTYFHCWMQVQDASWDQQRPARPGLC